MAHQCRYATIENEWRDGLRIIAAALTTGRVPDSYSTLSAQQQYQLYETWGYTLGAGLLVMLMMLRSSRWLLLDSLETVAVSILIVLLLGIVLAMPFATIYIGYRGVSFVAYQLINAYRRS